MRKTDRTLHCRFKSQTHCGHEIDGTLVDTIGTGDAGAADGAFDRRAFIATRIGLSTAMSRTSPTLKTISSGASILKHAT
jgi:hypothetical protein